MYMASRIRPRVEAEKLKPTMGVQKLTRAEAKFSVPIVGLAVLLSSLRAEHVCSNPLKYLVFITACMQFAKLTMHLRADQQILVRSLCKSRYCRYIHMSANKFAMGL